MAIGLQDVATVDSTRVRDRTRRRMVVACLAAAAVVGVLAPLAMAAWSGSLSIPHNDAWAFSKAAQTFARTGHIHLLGWNSMSLVGLFIPLGPLGASIKAQQCYVAVIALIGLLASYDIFRREAGPWRAGLGVLVLVSWPGFGLLSTSMMTDMPAFTAMAVSLALGRRALDRSSWWLWALFVAVSFWGFTVRQQTIVAPLGIFVAALWPRDWSAWNSWRSWCNRRNAVVIGFGAVLLAGDLIFDQWRKGLAGGGSPSGQIHWPGMERVATMGPGIWLVLGLFLSPLVILVARPSRWAWPARLTGIVVFGVLSMTVVGYKARLPQDYFQTQGAYASAYLGDRPGLFPQELWIVLTALAVVSGALLAGVVVHKLRSLRVDLMIVLVLTLAGTVLELVAGQILFDRYMLPLILPLGALLLKEPVGSFRRARAGLASLVWIVLTTLTTLIMLNALTYDAVTWKAADTLVASSEAKAAYVNAGFAWTAYHSSTGARGADPNAEVGTFKQTPLFSDDEPCFVIAASPQSQHGWMLIGSPRYRSYGFFGSTGHLYVYRTTQKDCG